MRKVKTRHWTLDRIKAHSQLQTRRQTHVRHMRASKVVTHYFQETTHYLRPGARRIYFCEYSRLFQRESREGYKYVVCFVDHETKISWVYAIKTRDEYIEKLEQRSSITTRTEAPS